jgi:hypothetical protein
VSNGLSIGGDWSYTAVVRPNPDAPPDSEHSPTEQVSTYDVRGATFVQVWCACGLLLDARQDLVPGFFQRHLLSSGSWPETPFVYLAPSSD